MKKVIIALILIFFVSGCLQAEEAQPTEEEVPEEAETPEVTEETPEEAEIPGEEVPEEPEVNATEEELPEVEVQTEFNMSVGETVNVSGKSVNVLELHSDGKMDLDVAGTKLNFKETQQTEIRHDLEITMLRYHHRGSGNQENYVLLKITPFTLGENEYLIFKNEKATVSAIDIKLIDVRIDDWIWVSLSGNATGYDSIKEGRTKTFTERKVDKVEITNVKQFHKDRLYAILKIVPL